MKKIQVTLTTKITVDFDEKSTDFIELFENYNKYFSEVDYNEFAEIIATEIAKYGGNNEIEGVGLVKLNGRKQRASYFPLTDEIDHPINIDYDFDINGYTSFDVEESRQL